MRHSACRDNSKIGAAAAPERLKAAVGRIGGPDTGFVNLAGEVSNRRFREGDDECMEALLRGRGRPVQGDYHGGVIAATNHRVAFVSNAWADRPCYQLPPDEIAGVYSKGEGLRLDAPTD